ncbi:MAG: DUF3786 domain-containing protein [Candidatus Helarchaeota archaeon]
MNDRFDFSNFIKLTNFSGGWVWVSHINQKIRMLLPYLEKISKEKLHEIWELIRAEEKPWKPYPDIEFCVLIKPISNFGFLLIFRRGDEEFPSELITYYEKTSLEVPTEDAYVFSEVYLELIIQIAKAQNILIIDTPDLITLRDLADKHPDLEKEKVYHDIIGQRFEPLKVIDQKTAEKIASKLNINYISEWGIDKAIWVLEFNILEDLSIYYVLCYKDSGLDMKIYYNASVLKYEPFIITNFSWLFLNAIIREGRKILGDKMPKISEYL